VAFLKYLGVVILAVWVGGSIVLAAVAAPSLFASLAVADPIQGRTTAGVVFGAMFHRFQLVSWVLGGLMLALLATRAALGPRPRRLAVRIYTVLAMVLVSVGSELVVARRIEALRRDLPANLAQVSSDDPRRIEFGRWHAVSTGLMGLTVIAGLGLLWAETHD